MIRALLSALVAGALFFAGPAHAAKDAWLSTADGQKIRAITDRASGATKGVVLVHMLNREASDWSYFSGRLVESGFTVVAPDLRGHGANRKDEQELGEADYQAMINDVAAAVAWLRANGVTEVSCVGASIGANLCLQAASADAGIVNLVLLSPGLNYKSVTTAEAMRGYGARPVLLVASAEDKYAARSAQLLEDAAVGQKHLEMLDGAGHGTKMLNREPSLEGTVQSWLRGTFQLASGEVVRPAPAMQSNVGTVETEGKKLDAHQ